MHELPLLVQASPKTSSVGVTRLRAGLWSFSGTVKDTEFFIRVCVPDQAGGTGISHYKIGDYLELRTPGTAQVVITKPGTEKGITILAKHHGQCPPE